MGQVWNELQPKLGCLFGSNNGLKSNFWDPNAQRGRGETKLTVRIQSWEKNWATVLYHIVYIPFNKTIFLSFEFSSWKIQQACFAIPCSAWRNDLLNVVFWKKKKKPNQCIRHEGWRHRMHSSLPLQTYLHIEVFYTNIIENIWRAVFFFLERTKCVFDTNLSIKQFSGKFYILWKKMCNSCCHL